MKEQKLLRSRNKARRDGNESLLVEACTDLANLYKDEGKYASAIEHYKTVADIYKKQNKMLEFAVANRGIGEAYLGLRNFEQALHHQKLYLEIAKKLNNMLHQQRALASIGHIYLTRHFENPVANDQINLNLANKNFSKSLLIAESLNGEVCQQEIADMSARLYSNLGIVQDCLGNFRKASELINKSVNLCKDHDIYEQLYRGYVSLASLLEKQGENNEAVHQYNLAIETSKILSSQPVLKATALLGKSELLIKLGDFQAAKAALFKAYKLKIRNIKERQTIENNLRVVAAMTSVEKKLLATKDNEYEELKKLYEKLGDGACELKCYEKGVEYYKKMLKAVNKSGAGDVELASCYYSLAETLKDNGQYKESVKYFEKEFELCKSLKDGLNTLSHIADTKETANEDIMEVKKIYEKAIAVCQKEGDIHEEGRMLKRFIGYLRRQGRHTEAFSHEEKLRDLNYESSDNESDEGKSQPTSHIGQDVNLDDVTDISSESDDEQSTSAGKAKRRNKNFKIKRNAKGETQLHTVCMTGKFNIVTHLLQMGHPVNVRDNYGWLPLHEACNYGYLEIVRALLDKGAAINDRGGVKCEGVTPLHDAASNGHLAVVQLLLDRGANAVAKTDAGETVLHNLKLWRDKNQLDEETNELYEKIFNQISTVLEKSGQNADSPIASTSRAFSSDLIDPESENMDRMEAEYDDLSTESAFETMKKSPYKATNMRRSKFAGLDDDSGSESSNAAEDYRNVMNNLKNKKMPLEQPKKTVEKRPALIAEAEYIGDNWLEDDIGNTSKKRKTNSPSKTQRPSNSPRTTEKVSPRLPIKSRKTSISSMENGDFRSSFPSNDAIFIDSDDDNGFQNSGFNRKRKHQAKLTSFGHTRIVVEADSTSSPNFRRNSLGSRTSSSPVKMRQNEPVVSQAMIIDPTVSVDVRVVDKLYRVPVLLSQVNTHNIKWLAEEAALRYARKEYMRPTLELETKNGAILADDDPISLLFPMGTLQSEEVTARIIRCNVPPLIDRFKEVCLDLATEPNELICKALRDFTLSLNLSENKLRDEALAPLCKALNRQNTLLELNVSGNFLWKESIGLLAASLPSLTNLSNLNLSCVGLTSIHLQNLGASFTSALQALDLSYNRLDDNSFKSLAQIAQPGSIKTLNLSNNEFRTFNENCVLNLGLVEDFDISDNELNNEALVSILKSLKPEKVKKLNVSRNILSVGFLAQLLISWSPEMLPLEDIQLSRCHVQDFELFDLLILCDNLQYADLSYNNELTCVSLRRLLDKVEVVNLGACENLFRYSTEFTKLRNLRTNILKLSVDFAQDLETIEYLEKLWKDRYGNAAVVEKNGDSYFLSIIIDQNL